MYGYVAGDDGIFYPKTPIVHRDDEYDQAAFKLLLAMQEKHFWYRGRHRFLTHSFDRQTVSLNSELSAIDLGGGVGGWVSDLWKNRASRFRSLALADSSVVALQEAASIIPPKVERYQIDLMNLDMHDEWDVAFLLDVIEHLPNDEQALVQTKNALKPGGLLFVTTPALQKFWSYNDEVAHHVRRYSRSDFQRLADNTGMKLIDSRYFMFLLSPLYLLSRLKPGIRKLTIEEKEELFVKHHAIPAWPINSCLSLIFAAESPLGHWVHFPWGTSILGVFQKPSNVSASKRSI